MIRALELAAAALDLVLSDPPYSSGARRDAERTARGASMLRGVDDAEWFSHDTMTTWGFSWFIRSILVELRPALAGGSHLYLFSDWRQDPTVRAIMESSGYRVNNVLTWDKEAFGLGATWRNQEERIVFGSLDVAAPMLDKGCGTIIRCPAIHESKRVHPTEKPIPLLERIIRAVPGQRLIDPFAGSCSTLVAAKQHGRKAIGIELDPKYCAIGRDRLIATLPGIAQRVEAPAAPVEQLDLLPASPQEPQS